MLFNDRLGKRKGMLFATLLLCASIETSIGFSSFGHPSILSRESSPVMNAFQGQKKISCIQNKVKKFECYSHSGVEDMESFQSDENKERGRGILKRTSVSISKATITKNVKFITKCLAFSLMLCSLRPNLSVAKVFSKSVSPGTSLTSAKRTGAIIRTVIIGGLVGVGAIQVLRQQTDFSLKEQLEQQRERFSALVSIVRSKPDATTDDSTSQEEDAAAKKAQADAEMAAARIQEEKDRLAMEAETAKKEIEEALRKQKEDEDKMKQKLELEAKKADLVKKMVAEAEKRAEEARLKEEKEAEMKALEEEKAREAAKIKEENEAKMKVLEEEQAKDKEEMTNPLTQPKSPDLENVLATKYNSIQDLEEKAFTILADLKMIQKTPDPNDPNYDNSKDDEIASENIFLKYSNKKD